MNLYIINVKKYFPQACENLSEHRKKKILYAKNELVKSQNVAVSSCFDVALSPYGLAERDMKYRLNEYGKPRFDGNEPFKFCISHSGDIVALATDYADIGLDIEPLSRKIEDKVIERFFTKFEQNWALSENPNKEYRKLLLWVTMESVVKLSGDGFAVGHEKICIPYFEDEAVVEGIHLKKLIIDGNLFVISSKEKITLENIKILKN